MALAPRTLQNMHGMHEALAYDGAASGFDDAGTDEMAGEAEVGVAHQVGVFPEIAEHFLEFLRLGGAEGEFFDAGGGFAQQVFDAAHVQKAVPVALLRAVQVEGLGEFAEVFAGAVEIDDVDGAGKVGGGDGFVVSGAVGEDDDLPGALAPPAKGFLMDAQAEEGAGFDGSDIGRACPKSPLSEF